MTKYTNPITAEDLRTFCINHEYFTSGSSEQYSRMFDLCRMGASIEALASVIWACSPCADLNEITEQLNDLTRWPIWVKSIRRTLEAADWGEAEIEIICEAVRTHPEAGKAYKVIED